MRAREDSRASQGLKRQKQRDETAKLAYTLRANHSSDWPDTITTPLTPLYLDADWFIAEKKKRIPNLREESVKRIDKTIP